MVLGGDMHCFFVSMVFKDMGANVPAFLMKGLDIVNKKVEDITNSSTEGE